MLNSILNQSHIAHQAADATTAATLALLARHVARRTRNAPAEAAALLALGRATGDTRHVEAALRLWAREPTDAARYNEALCGLVIARLTARRVEAMVALERALAALSPWQRWIGSPLERKAAVLRGEIEELGQQVVPVVWVEG